MSLGSTAMRLPRRALVLLLAVATVPLGAAVAVAAHAGSRGVQQASPFGAPTPPPHVRSQQPPRPGLTPAARVNGAPGRLSPAQVQALAQAQQPPASVPT